MGMTGTGMANQVVDALVTAGKYPGLNAGDIASLKADMAVSYQAMIDYMNANAVIKTSLDTGLNPVFSAGIPVPNDGGTALQTAWKSATSGGAADDSTGTIE